MKKYKILVVDDEEEFATTLAERLVLRGMNARTAFDGHAALEQLEQELPDVVVLDVMMPGISGLSVLQQIKEKWPQVGVILLTGRGSTQNGIEGMHLGAVDYLMKPIDIDELMDKIKQAASAREESLMQPKEQ